MFLRLLRVLHRDQGGAALASVVGVMAVALILCALILTNLTRALSYTSASQAGLQSQAASDGGLAVVQAAIERGTCTAAHGPVFTSASGALPKYRATVSRATATGPWETGCPTSTSTRVKVVSTGTAAAAGVIGNSVGDESFVEAVYSLPVAAASVSASGPAIYAYSSSGFGGSGKLVSIDGSSPSVLVKTGNVLCDGAATAAADWVVDGGTFTTGGSCAIGGNVWSSGAATMGGTTVIAGNVVASSFTGNNGTVEGSVWATGLINITWGSIIKGSATGQNLTLAGGDVFGMAWARNNAAFDASILMSGSLTAKTTSGGTQTTFKGTKYVNSSVGAGPAAPVAPIVAPWVNFGYKLSDWPGYTQTVVTGGNDYNTGGCGFVKLKQAVEAFGTSPGIIDARTCTNDLTFSGYEKLPVKANLVILSNKFNLSGSGGFQAVTGSGKHKIWLITPDETVESPTRPSCVTGSKLFLGGSHTFDPTNLSTMIYSPCVVDVASGLRINGQIFAGGADIAGDATVGYVPIGLPNANLTTGVVGPPPANPALTLVSVRNVATGG
jgi:cytoskeletal protein CcmA (bactofilin family)